jgi:hypothetical protein
MLKEIQKGLFCRLKNFGIPFRASAESFSKEIAAPDKERRNTRTMYGFARC